MIKYIIKGIFGKRDPNKEKKLAKMRMQLYKSTYCKSCNRCTYTSRGCPACKNWVSNDPKYRVCGDNTPYICACFQKPTSFEIRAQICKYYRRNK